MQQGESEGVGWPTDARSPRTAPKATTDRPNAHATAAHPVCGPSISANVSDANISVINADAGRLIGRGDSVAGSSIRPRTAKAIVGRRCRQVDEEDPAPRCVLDQQAAEGRPDQRADARPRGPQSDRAAALRAERRAEQRQAVRREQRSEHALEHPSGDEERRVRRDAAQRRSDREAGDPDGEERPAAEPIAQRAGHDVERGDGQRVGEHDPLLGRKAGVELAADRGQRDVHDAAVDEGDRRPDDGRDQREPAPIGDEPGRRGRPAVPRSSTPARRLDLLPRSVTV